MSKDRSRAPRPRGHLGWSDALVQRIFFALPPGAKCMHYSSRANRIWSHQHVERSDRTSGFSALRLQTSHLRKQKFATRKACDRADVRAGTRHRSGRCLHPDAAPRLRHPAASGQLDKVQPGCADAVAAIAAAFAPLISCGTLTTGLASQPRQIAKMIAANGAAGLGRRVTPR